MDGGAAVDLVYEVCEGEVVSLGLGCGGSGSGSDLWL